MQTTTDAPPVRSGMLDRDGRVGVVGVLARLILGGALLWAGLAKVTTPLASARAVQAYDLLPYDLAAAVGYALPIVEIAVGAVVVAGLFTRWAALAGTVMMLVFIAGIASAWARGLTIDCGCFGGGGAVEAGATRYLEEIVRDAAFVACGAWLVWRPRTPWSVDARLDGHRERV